MIEAVGYTETCWRNGCCISKTPIRNESGEYGICVCFCKEGANEIYQMIIF